MKDKKEGRSEGKEGRNGKTGYSKQSSGRISRTKFHREQKLPWEGYFKRRGLWTTSLGSTKEMPRAFAIWDEKVKVNISKALLPLN